MNRDIESIELYCDDCGVSQTKNESVRETTCPFAEEISGREVQVTLCDDCYKERLWDI